MKTELNYKGYTIWMEPSFRHEADGSNTPLAGQYIYTVIRPDGQLVCDEQTLRNAKGRINYLLNEAMAHKA